MINKGQRIIVTGDVCINSLVWQNKSSIDSTLNYNLYPKVCKRYEVGGALLLAKLVAEETEIQVASPEIEDISLYLNDNVLVSVSYLKKYPLNDKKQNKHEVYRVEEYEGYYIKGSEDPKTFPVINDNEDAEIVVLDDNNNGFNLNEDVCPLAIKSPNKKPII